MSVTGRGGVIEHLRRNPDVSVLIVGGGINGAGTFRDLALQGVDVLLIDKADFCSGASAASSRMIHGGLRYLEFGEFRLVREALHERNLLLRNAPHYVHPLPTTIPVRAWFSGMLSCFGRFLGIGANRPADRGAVMVKLGLTFYDIFTAGQRLMPRHKFTSRKKALARRPSLPPDIICTATYYDSWVSYPERLCLELLQDGEALCPLARAANYVSLEDAKGAEVVLRDEVTGESLTVRPRVVINAAGAWIDLANRAIGRETAFVGGTKGAHLLVDSQPLLDAFDGEMIYFEAADGRTAVALPWLGKALIGTTDIRTDDPDRARCEEEEVDYIFEAIHRVFPDIPIERSQIVSRFSGVRPLPRSKTNKPGEISRDHRCVEVEPGDGLSFPVLSLVGGKWTTFRAFSEQVADSTLRRLGVQRHAGTREMAIGGGKQYPQDERARAKWIERVAIQSGLSPARLATLLDRYGTRAEAVAAFVVAAPDTALQSHDGYSRREIEFILENERVVHIEDLVLRRTTMALLGELTAPLLVELASIMEELRGWRAAETAAEIERTRDILSDRFSIRMSEGPAHFGRGSATPCANA